MKPKKSEKNKNLKNLLETLLESAEDEIILAADELGADGVGFVDEVDRVAENVAEEVEILENFGGLSEEKENFFQKNQNFSEKVEKFEDNNDLVANLEKVGEVWGGVVKCEVAGGVVEEFSDGKEMIPAKNERKNFEKKQKTSLSEGIVENLLNSEKEK